MYYCILLPARNQPVKLSFSVARLLIHLSFAPSTIKVFLAFLFSLQKWSSGLLTDESGAVRCLGSPTAFASRILFLARYHAADERGERCTVDMEKVFCPWFQRLSRIRLWDGPSPLETSCSCTLFGTPSGFRRGILIGTGILLFLRKRILVYRLCDRPTGAKDDLR